MFLLLIIVGSVAICFCLCTSCLCYLYVWPQLKERLAQGSSGSKTAEETQNDDDDDEGGESYADTIKSFLDAAWLQGMDDAVDLEINPVLKYKVDEEKRELVREAREGASGGGDGSVNPLRGVPGAIARLNWALDQTAADNKDEAVTKEKRRQMKTIEGYISRTFEVDVAYETVKSNALAGGVRFNALEVAKRTEVERVGGRRGSTLALVAQQSRAQLNAYMIANPGGPQSSSALEAYGVQPPKPMGFDDVQAGFQV